MGTEDTLVQHRAIKVLIEPTPEQCILIQKTFGCCRYIWNNMLMDENDFYIQTDKHFIPTPAKYKKNAPFLKEVDSLALCNVQLDLKQAFKRFFEDPNVGYPNVKSKKRSRDVPRNSKSTRRRKPT